MSLIQKLVDHARTIDSPPPHYATRPIRWVIDLDVSGALIGAVDVGTAKRGGVVAGSPMLAPSVVRTVANVPILLADTGSYALGVAETKAVERGKRDRSREKYAAFLDLTRRCAEDTGHLGVAAVITFLEGAQRQSLIESRGIGEDEPLTFRVDGCLLIDDPAVRRFWARERSVSGDQTTASSSGGIMACAVCGVVGPVLDRHPLSIKGVVGGSGRGGALISANDPAYWSYGRRHSTSFPMCEVCALAYLNALEALRADERTWLRIGEKGPGARDYYIWADTGRAGIDLSTLNNPQPEIVAALLASPKTAKVGPLLVPKSNAINIVGLRTRESRIVVCSWLNIAEDEARANLGMWFAAHVAVPNLDGSLPGAPVPLWRLARTSLPVKDGKNQGDIPHGVTDALLETALVGRRLPDVVIAEVVQRCRADRGVRRDQGVVLEIARQQKERRDMDTDDTESVAMRLGRVLAILAEIQRRAVNPRSGIVDAYYGAMSATPGLVIGALLGGSAAHLKKLQRSDTTRGAGIALERQLSALVAALPPQIPRSLSVMEQGEFALGYYREIAEREAARRERQTVRADRENVEEGEAAQDGG